MATPQYDHKLSTLTHETSLSLLIIQLQKLVMAHNDEEKKPLLGDSTNKEDDKIVDADSYGVHSNIQESLSDQSWFQKNKERIPGYGLLSLWKQV